MTVLTALSSTNWRAAANQQRPPFKIRAIPSDALIVIRNDNPRVNEGGHGVRRIALSPLAGIIVVAGAFGVNQLLIGFRTAVGSLKFSLSQ